MLCLRARLPRQSADSPRRTSRQGFAHKLPCRRRKKHALHALRRSAALKGGCAKVFPCTVQRGLGVYAEAYQRFQAARRMTPLRCRCALHRKRELCLCGNMQFCRGGAALASPFGVNGRLTASEQKQLGARKKGARGAPFGLPVGTRTRNNAVGGHRFIQLDYG